jgi:phosphatidylethanolamine/phosphatidyl-N-methylethanolamine N-methyltransferase
VWSSLSETSPDRFNLPKRRRPVAPALVVRIENEMRATAGELIGKVADARLNVRSQQLKFEGGLKRTANDIKRTVGKLQDDARFLKNWVESPLKLGAVTPSSVFLARAMAARVDPSVPGPVVEIGPGTGPVTQALIARGIAEERLILVEFNPEFCELLRKRFPKALVIEGDAYALGATLAGILTEPAAAIVSSLPLTTRKTPERLALIDCAFQMMQAGAPFVQFTYAMVSPIPVKRARVLAKVSDWVLRNLPPARVWTYHRA